MPCVWSEFEYGQDLADSRRRMAKLDAMLCAVITALQRAGLKETVLDGIDWKEAGITRDDILEWQAAHDAADARRREMEAKVQEEREVKRAAEKERQRVLDTLSPEQRKALGL